MIAKGTFEVTMEAEPPFDDVQGVSLARVAIHKRFSGALDATSKVQMLAARTPVPTSAAYVAVERVEGALDGRRGTFVLVHLGIQGGANACHSVLIAPDSGTDELRGIAGKMTIRIEDRRHFYDLDYTLEHGAA